MPPTNIDRATLGRALRGARAQRDRVVLLHVGETALSTPEKIASLAEVVALLRIADARAVVLLDDAPAGAARRFEAAIAGHGERGVTLAAATAVTVHRIDAAPTPTFISVIDVALVGQLAALRFVPIIALPVLDVEGVASEVPAGEVAHAAATLLGATALVCVDAHRDPALDDGTRRVIRASSAALDALLEDILLGPPPVTATEVTP